jgi:hypothetical protein
MAGLRRQRCVGVVSSSVVGEVSSASKLQWRNVQGSRLGRSHEAVPGPTQLTRWVNSARLCWPISNLRPTPMAHWPCFSGSGQRSCGSTRPVPILIIYSKNYCVEFFFSGSIIELCSCQGFASIGDCVMPLIFGLAKGRTNSIVTSIAHYLEGERPIRGLDDWC